MSATLSFELYIRRNDIGKPASSMIMLQNLTYTLRTNCVRLLENVITTYTMHLNRDNENEAYRVEVRRIQIILHVSL